MSRRIRSEFGTLGERVQATTGQPTPEGATPTSDEEAAEPTTPPEMVEPLPDVLHITRDQVRWVEPAHVWVDQAHAGLLLGWARPGEGWLARVVWVAPGAGEVVVDWLTQDQVAPRR